MLYTMLRELLVLCHTALYCYKVFLFAVQCEDFVAKVTVQDELVESVILRL